MPTMFINCNPYYNNSDCRITATFSTASNIESSVLFAIYVAITILELLAVVVMAVITTIAIVDISRSSKFHPNMMRMISFYFGQGYVGTAARVLLMLWQFGWISNGGSTSALLFISLLRFYWIFLSAYMFSAFVIERAFATILIADYEAQQRNWISTSLFVALFVVCQAEAALVVFGSALGSALSVVKAAVAVAVVSATISGTAGAVLFKINANRLRRLDYTGDEYTLGIKYQLLENHRAFKLLLLVSSFASITVVVACSFLFLAISYIEYNAEFASMMGACFDAIVTFGCLTGLCIIVFFEKEWRIVVVERLRLNRWVDISRDSPIIKMHPEEEVSMHFAELEKSWNKEVDTSC